MKSVKLNLLIAVGLVLLLSTPVQSQFVETFRGQHGGWSEGLSLIESSDGGILVTGDIYDISLTEHVLLAKFNAQGKLIWSRALGGDEGFSVVEASDGGIVVTGSASFGADSGDVLLTKFSASGDTLWTKTLGGTGKDEGRCVIKGLGEQLVVTGYTESFGAGSGDLLLATLNASGDTLWTRTLGGPNKDAGQSVVWKGGVYLVVTGYTESSGAGGRDLLLTKFSASGYTLFWTKTLGGTSNDEGRAVIVASGGYVVTGYTESFGAGGRDLLLAKFDWDGDTLWTRTLGGPGAEEGLSVIQTSDGGLVVTGSTSLGAYGGDLLLAKFDGSGNLLWTRTIGFSYNNDVGQSVIQTPDGDLVVAGWTYDWEAQGGSGLLAKFDVWGNNCMGGYVTPTVLSVSPDLRTWDPTVNWISPTFNSQSPPCTSLVPYAYVWCEAPPKIDTITDVGNDQGRQVRVKWNRCSWDSVWSPVTITEYTLWRRVDQYKGNSPDQDFVVKEVESLDQMLENIVSSKYGDRYLITKTGDLWDFIVTVPAMQFSEYRYVAPTLADSTYEDGMYWSVFFVSAHTQNPTVHYDSDPDSGYSLDNIPPLPIPDLAVNPNSWFTLQWTVPGEYVGEHPISTYNIKYDTIPPSGADTQAWWDSATACAGDSFFNFIVGAEDSIQVAKKSWNHPVVYFAIKGLDDRPNYSEISNIVRFKCGDVNGDGGLNAADVVYLINYLFISGPPPVPMAVGDVNCNGTITASDVVYLINYLFISGPKPCSSP